MLRAAVIGASGFGAAHCADLLGQHRKGRLAIVGAVVRNPSNAAEMCAKLQAAGATIFSDHARMFSALSGGLDLCMIPTSIPTHAELTIAALEAGSHVLVEKPAAATLAQVDAMLAASSAADRLVAVGFQNMYAAETMLMKRVIVDKEIGDLVSLKCLGMWPRLDRYYASSWVGRIHAGSQPVFDSPANNAMAHQLNMMCFLAGETQERTGELASAEAELYRAHDIETADIVALRLKTRGGVQIMFLATHASEVSRNPQIVISGTKGHMIWTFENLHIARADGTSQDLPTSGGPALREAMMTRILDRIEGKPGFVCELDIARTHTLAIEAMHRSSAVTPLAGDLLSRSPCDGSIKTVVAGLDSVLQECFLTERLPSEAGVSWAVPGQFIPLGASF